MSSCSCGNPDTTQQTPRNLNAISSEISLPHIVEWAKKIAPKSCSLSSYVNPVPGETFFEV